MRFIIFSILTGLLLGGCGTKGALYLPENRYPQPAAAPTPTPEEPANETAPVEKPQEPQ